MNFKLSQKTKNSAKLPQLQNEKTDGSSDVTHSDVNTADVTRSIHLQSVKDLFHFVSPDSVTIETEEFVERQIRWLETHVLLK